jgi:two-component system, NarL family, invasion response regulator UvrY
MKLGDQSPATGAVRVLTIDDQAVFRALAREVINATPGFASIGEAADGSSGIEAVERLGPDLVLLDVRMPGMDGIETARRLVDADWRPVVVLISIDEMPDAETALAATTAVACVRKQDLSIRKLHELWAALARQD